jgi:hypothetical protein
MKFIFLALMLLCGTAFAGCATDALTSTCNGCLRNATTPQAKEACSQQMGAGVLSCYAQQYPMMIIAASNQNCSELEQCTAQLQVCVIPATMGNETLLCSGAPARACFERLDTCAAAANTVCAQRGQQAAVGTVSQSIGNLCPCGGGLILLAVLLGALLL